MIMDIMNSLSDVIVNLPVEIGQVIVPDILNTGADIIATRSL